MAFQHQLYLKLLAGLLVIITSLIINNCQNTPQYEPPDPDKFPIYNSNEETNMLFQDHKHKRWNRIYEKCRQYLKVRSKIFNDIMELSPMASIYLLVAAARKNDKKTFNRVLRILKLNGIEASSSRSSFKYLERKSKQNWRSLVIELRKI